MNRELSKARKRFQIILRELRKGGVVIAGRQCGKTTALLTLARELGANNCIVVCHSKVEAKRLADRWCVLFPEKRNQPTEFVSAWGIPNFRGTKKQILVDGLRDSHYDGR